MNIREIAEIAGVSTSTVSKIVNHKDESIAQATRERVLAVVKQYHYRPYAAVDSTQSTWRIGVLLNDCIGADSTVDGIIQAAQKRGYSTLIFNSFRHENQEEANLASALSQKVDGIIWEPVSRRSFKRLEKRLTVPKLTIGPIGDDPYAMLPYEQASYYLTEELIRREHTHIACLVGNGRRTTSFIKGYKRALFDHGLKYDSRLIHRAADHELITHISSHEITGIVSSHYRLALELAQYTLHLHYHIPDDFSLLTLRNDTSEPLHYPGSQEISAYTMHSADFGAYLCARLITNLEGGGEPAAAFGQDFHLDNDHTISGPPRAKRRTIVVVGSVNIDTYISVASLPKPGHIVDSHAPFTIPGGKGINQAVGVAKLGQQVSLIASVGADSAADYVYRSLAKEGINTSGILRKEGQDTGKVFILVDSEGKSMTSRIAGANLSLTANDVRNGEQLFDHASYCLIQTVVPMEAVEEACRLARKHGTRTIIKPFFSSHLPVRILRQCDILVPSESELDQLCPGPGSQADKAHRLLRAGVNTVIVTAGERGCTLYTTDLKQDFPTEPVKPIDDTGAGDAFISALAAYLLEGRTMEEAIRIANRAAGLSLMQEGVISSLPDRAQLESSLQMRS